MNDNNDAPDFIGALQGELGITAPPEENNPPEATPPATVTPPTGQEGAETPPPAASDNKPAATDPPAQTDGDKTTPPVAEKTDEEKAADAQAEADKSKNETAEETATRQANEAKQNDEDEAKKYATAEDVKQAIREVNQESTGRIEKVHTVREEIINKLHPEGIDRNIYDTDGKVIKTAQDIVDRGLINERTGEAFTYEEAASFMLEATREMNENINKLNDWAEDVAEKNISLVESNDRVMDQWGDILKAMPQLAKELADEYITTQLEFDKTGSYITKMSMSPEAYYGRVMAPYRKLGEALAAQQALQANQQAEQQNAEQRAEQAERSGLPPQRGQSEVKANTGNSMLDALVDELNKG